MSIATFETPTHTPSRGQLVDERQRARSLSWLGFWAATWLGTTLAGGALGATIGLIGLINGEWGAVPAFGMIGLAWAGGIGAIAIPHVALLKWMFWIRCSPKMLAGIAGGVTGCLTPLLPISGPLGAVGAVLMVKKFLKVCTVGPVHESERLRIEGHGSRVRSYSLKDLFLRVTALATVIAFWKFMLS